MESQEKMSITNRDVSGLIEKVAPLETAADWDRVGYQCGNPDETLETAVIALDVREETIRLAVKENAGLIISHHPLIFRPLERIDPRQSPGKELSELLANRIALYVGHTNVDASPEVSMNATIGRLLELQNVSCMAAPHQSPSVKLVTFVPQEKVDEVRAALSEAGAGVIGDYTHCSFSSTGTGSFLGSSDTDPAVGSKGQLERVDEIRLEMICPKNGLDRILSSLWESHPYEEVAYDLYPTAGYQTDKHFLWRGELQAEMTLHEFANLVRNTLSDGVAPVKFAGDPGRQVRKITWCSGGGKSLIEVLSGEETDVYLTGDTGHHDALNLLSRGISLVDIDHYYSEWFFIGNLIEYLDSKLEGAGVRLLEDRSGPVYIAAARDGLK